MLGAPAVGKSSLVSQFMTSEYLHAYDTSIGESITATIVKRSSGPGIARAGGGRNRESQTGYRDVAERKYRAGRGSSLASCPVHAIVPPERTRKKPAAYPAYASDPRSEFDARRGRIELVDFDIRR